MFSADKIKALAAEQYDWAVSARRALHKIPEPGWREDKTRAFIINALKEMGAAYEVSPSGWITASVKGDLPGKVTGFRGDFDGLPVQEPMGCGFESEHPGYMHACGHDMHTALLLATARLLCGLKGAFPGTCVLFFEPAEETDGGAHPMADSGLMEKYAVDRVYGLHVMPRICVGQIESRPGTLNAGTDEVTLIVNGTASHGAYPENGKDAIVCAGQLISALQSVVSRTVSPLENAVLTIGTIQGGKASNIICDRVEMHGTLRTADEKLRSRIVERIRDICEGTGKAFGCEIECRITQGYNALVNTPAEAERVLRLAGELFGPQSALVKEAPSMGAEDFSYFLDHAPGAFFHVGCSKDPEHLCAPLHSEKFLPEEEALYYGLCMEAALVLKN